MNHFKKVFMEKGKKKSNKYFDSFFNDHIKIIMCLNYYFFLEFRPEGQAILRQKREKLQRFPRYKRSYIIRNGLKPNLQLIAGLSTSGKKMGNRVPYTIDMNKITNSKIIC